MAEFSTSTGTFTVWDPYPQFDASSAWSKLLTSCGSSAGVTVKRTGYDTTDLTNKTLLAAQQGNAPDVLIVDNPVVSTLAEAGALATTADTKIETSAFLPNLIAAGQSGDKTYGVPIGANTMALYYNKKILDAAGVDPSTITTWDALTAALAKVKAAGDTGITFSAIGTEEGSFQFLPWFWGSGANLTKLDSSQGVAAVNLWTSWLKAGYAPNSVIQDTQTTSWQEFAAGKTAFAENGTWQLGNAKSAGFEYGIIPIPSQAGGTAPAPTGGEFVTVPVQSDTGLRMWSPPERESVGERLDLSQPLHCPGAGRAGAAARGPLRDTCDVRVFDRCLNSSHPWRIFSVRAATFPGCRTTEGRRID